MLSKLSEFKRDELNSLKLGYVAYELLSNSRYLTGYCTDARFFVPGVFHVSHLFVSRGRL